MDRDFVEAYQFKISLLGIEPSIWRRIQVPGNYTFWDLHVAIQDAMGWQDYHLHVFRISKPSSNEVDQIGIPGDYGLKILPEWELRISDYFSIKNNLAEYEYDFGDSWTHEVNLEKILPREIDAEYPQCIAGRRECPPEDCGGVWGYQEMLEAVFDPNHEDHEQMLEWVGESFNPEEFDAEQVSFDDPRERWERAFGQDKE